MGTRQNSIEGDSTHLYFNFFKNGLRYNAYRVVKVEIYDRIEKADEGLNPIETIEENDITQVVTETGRYSYTASPIASAGTYFDKIFILPEDNGSLTELTYISPFYIRKESYGGSAPGDKETAIVYLNVFDVLNNPVNRDYVEVQMNVDGAWYGSDFIKGKKEKFKVNAQGNVVRKVGRDYVEGMILLETDTLTEYTFPTTGDERKVYYKINICGQVNEKFEIQKGTLQANYNELPKIESDLD